MNENLSKIIQDVQTHLRLLKSFGLRQLERVEYPPTIEKCSSHQGAQQGLEFLRAEIGECQRCVLHQGRTKLVFGEGSPNARIVFAGEGPGRDEDIAGRPFVGQAGQLLDRMIVAMGLKREDVYICNVVKCRPPNNRTPEESEMRTCGIFLAKQLEIIRPSYVVALGATAAKYLTNTDYSMSRLRGRFFELPMGARLIATYHPAYLLRTPSAKKMVWEDLQKVMAEMNLPIRT
jgi:DNA polymerase